MKKRIISLLLVVVTLALTLAGCAYNYSKDSMSNYTKFDSAAFKDALLGKIEADLIKIKDGDYTTDKETNEVKITEYIYSQYIAKEAGEEHLVGGVVGAYDILYYNYYVTADFKGATDSDPVIEDVILYAAKMKESDATKLQLGITSTANEISLAIMEAIKDKDIKDYLYKTETDTTTELKAGNVVYVTYTYDYTDAEGAVKTVKATYEKMTLTEGDALSDKIISECQKVGTKKDFKITVDGVERSYKNVAVNWVVTSENKLGEFAVKDFDTKDSSGNPAKVTDVSGVSRELSKVKDGVLTYHVYPVYYQAVPEFNAEFILGVLLGASITADSFDVFKDESKKTADGKKLSELVTELKTLCTSRDAAETAYENAKKATTSAQSTYDKATEANKAAAETALNNAKTAEATAKETFDKAQKKVDDQITLILGIEGVSDKVIEGCREDVGEYLKGQYDSDILMKVAKAVWALVDKYVTLKDENSLPEKAVKDAEEKILEEYKSKFYTGNYTEASGSTAAVSNYKKYNGSFKDYLIATLASGKTYDDALAEVTKKAKESVTTVVKVYAVSEAFDCVLTDKEFKDEFVKGNASYDYLVQSYGENNVRTAAQFNELISTVLELNLIEEGENKGDMADYVERDGKKYLPFKNVVYTLDKE